MPSALDDPTCRLSRLRFGLRSSLLGFVILGILLVVFAIPYERERRQRLALERMGGTVAAAWVNHQVVTLSIVHNSVGPGPNLDGMLAELRHLPYVRQLSLENLRLSNEALLHLKYVPQLEELKLGGTFHLCDSLDVADYLSNEWRGLDVRTPEGLLAVKQDAWAGLLILRNSDINDDGMDHLRSLRSLRVLSLWNTGVSDEGLKKLSVLPNLEELDLRLSLVSDQGIEYLHNFPSLKKLDLGNNRRITGASLTHVGKLTRLTELRPPFATTDDTLTELYTLQNLRILDLTERQVSDEAIQALSEKLPNCKIKL